MKKLTASILALCMALSLTACGGKEQSATYRSTSEANGISMTDTMTFDAKGDKIHTVTETVVLDLSAFEGEEYDQMVEYCEQVASMYEGIDGVQCTVEEGEKSYTYTVVIDAKSETIDKLSELGLLQIEGSSKGISLKATGEALEAGGFEKVEE